MWGLHANVGLLPSKCPIMWGNFSLKCNCNQERNFSLWQIGCHNSGYNLDNCYGVYMNDNYQKIAYIALRNADGSYMLNVPLYIRLDDLNKNGVSDQQEELIHKVSEIMTGRYEKQIAEHIAALKQAKKDSG